jgi:oxalate decarboxylase
VQNIGDTDMQFFSVFRTSNFQEFSLSDWLKHSPAEMVAEHLNVDPTMVPRWPGANARIMPERAHESALQRYRSERDASVGALSQDFT